MVLFIRGLGVEGQRRQRFGIERDYGRLDRRFGGCRRESKGEYGKIGEIGRGQVMWSRVGWVENFDFQFLSSGMVQFILFL